MSSTASLRPTGREEVRRALIDAAGRNFAARGPAASLRDIAGDANVDLRLISRHFGNKEGLLRAVLDEYDGVDAALVSRTDDLASAMQLLYEQSQADGQHIRLFAWLALSDQRELLTDDQSAIRRLHDRASTRDQRVTVLAALALVYGWTIFSDQLLVAFERSADQRPEISRCIGDLLAWLVADGVDHAAAQSVAPRAVATPAATESTDTTGSRPTGREEVQQAILDAALRHFAKAGSNASLRDIAADARVNLGLIHRHFGNKDDLLRAVLNARNDAGLDVVTQAPTIAEGLRNLFEMPPGGTGFSRILAFLLLDGLPTEQFKDRYPTISAMRAGAANADQEMRLLAGFAIAHGWTVFGDSLLDALHAPAIERAGMRTRIGAVVEHLVVG